jgi:D-alanine transaminase
MKSALANWNGELMPLDEVRVSVLDRAFLFGDAIYEMLRVYGGRAFLLREHMTRLASSLKKLQINTDIARIETRLRETLSASGVQEGSIYIQITRGVAPRTHQFPTQPATPNELIYVKELAGDPYAEGRRNGISVIVVSDDRWKRCDIKSTNLLANCLASEAAVQAGCQEALLVDEKGEIVEGSHTSVFGVKDGAIWTTPLGPQVLPGITRRLVMKLAASVDVPIVEKSLMRSELGAIDELFVTGTTSEVLPVKQVDGALIGDGCPGPITNKLAAAYRGAIHELKSAANW